MAMTLKEIYQALVNDETLTDKDGNKVRIKNNKLVEEDGSQNYTSFAYPEDWSIYKDPNDPKNWIEKLCWVWDDNEEAKTITILTGFDDSKFKGIKIDESCYYKFGTSFGWHKNCRPLTREEVEQYLVKEN